MCNLISLRNITILFGCVVFSNCNTLDCDEIVSVADFILRNKIEYITNDGVVALEGDMSADLYSIIECKSNCFEGVHYNELLNDYPGKVSLLQSTPMLFNSDLTYQSFHLHFV